MRKIAVFSDFYEPLQRQINNNVKNEYHCFMNNQGAGSFDVAICFGDRHRFRSVESKIKIFVTGEPYGIIGDYGPLTDFDYVVSFREDIKGKAISKFVPFPWHIGINRRTGEFDKEFSYNSVRSDKVVILQSGKSMFSGHTARQGIIDSVIDLFKDTVEVIRSPFDDKKVIANYKYHLCIENTQINDYISEKLTDCLIAKCYPLYVGAPNVRDYFPDVEPADNLFKTLQKIACGEDVYGQSYPGIIRGRQAVLFKYNFFNYMDGVIDAIL